MEIAGFADTVVNVQAGGDVAANALGWLAGDLLANGSVLASAGTNFTGSIHADVDAALIALENVTGSTITAGNVAGVFAWNDAVDLTVSGDAGASLFAYHDLLGTVTSAAGPAEAFGVDMTIVTVDAFTDATASSLDELYATVTAGENGSVFANAYLNATVTAGLDAYAVSYADADVVLDAGRDAWVSSIGDMAAEVLAGRDARAVAYGDMQIDLDADHDVTFVGALGDLTGVISAGSYVKRVKSYGAIDAEVSAGGIPSGDPEYGTVGTVEAWEQIDGSISAVNQISYVRSAEAIPATLSAPAIQLVDANNPHVRGSIPDLPDHSVARTGAFLNREYRVLVQGAAGAAAARGGLVLIKDAMGNNLRQVTNPTIGDRRASEAVFTSARHKVAAGIAAVQDADEQLMQGTLDQYHHATKWTRAAWTGAVIAIEQSQHARLVELLNFIAERAAAEQAGAQLAAQLQTAGADARQIEMARLQEAVAQRPPEWKQDAAIAAQAESTGQPPATDWWTLAKRDYARFFAPWNNPASNDLLDPILHDGKDVGWGMTIVGSVGAATLTGIEYAAAYGLFRVGVHASGRMAQHNIYRFVVQHTIAHGTRAAAFESKKGLGANAINFLTKVKHVIPAAKNKEGVMIVIRNIWTNRIVTVIPRW